MSWRERNIQAQAPAKHQEAPWPLTIFLSIFPRFHLLPSSLSSHKEASCFQSWREKEEGPGPGQELGPDSAMSCFLFSCWSLPTSTHSSCSVPEQVVWAPPPKTHPDYPHFYLVHVHLHSCPPNPCQSLLTSSQPPYTSLLPVSCPQPISALSCDRILPFLCLKPSESSPLRWKYNPTP